MYTGAFYGAVRKHGYLIFESLSSSASDEAHVFESDIELSYESDSDECDCTAKRKICGELHQ